jgi:serine/threonine protein kinase
MDDVEKFEHFVIERRSDGSLWELGRGAMGVTYKAFDTNLRSDVALKVINAQYLHSETARQRFLREARSAASLRHPNVATVFHLGNSDGGFFYAMEYIDGETVEKRVQREGPMTLDLALRITRQVSRALIAADRQKLVHRDIKPSNIMLVVDEDEDHLLVKVIDFGLAKSLLIAADESITLSLGGFVGTPNFASPEQLEEKEIDIRSDIYSLGATLWYMLTGRPPFQGPMASVIHQHLSQPLPAEILMKLQPRVAALLEKMQAKDPAARFQTPAELKRELDDILVDLKGGSPTLAAPLAAPVSASSGSTTTSAFITGQLLRNRYQIFGQAEFDRTIFKAKDIQDNRIVALRPLPIPVRYENERVERLQQEITKLRSVHHPNLLEVLGYEAYDRGLFIISEWVKGFSLQELLRARRELNWDETLRIVKPLAKVLDFVADRQLVKGRLSLRNIYIENPQAPDGAPEMQRMPVSGWPPFLVKVDALAFGQIASEYMVEPTQTIVEPVASELPPNQVQQLSWIIYELLGGVRPANSLSSPRLNPLPNLSELGNTILRVAGTDSGGFKTASDFLVELERSESNRDTAIQTKVYPSAGRLPTNPTPSSVPAEDSRPRTSPVLLSILTGVLGLLLLGAIGAVLFVNFFINRPQPAVQASTRGSVSLTSKPEGATVKWNGQVIGNTPLVSYSLPVGKQSFELSLAGFKPQPVQVEISRGVLNNIGVIPLVRELGQLVLKSTPAGLPFEISDSENKITSGMTPQTIDSLAVGTYTVRIKRQGWGDYSQSVNLESGGVVTVDHAFQGVKVTLKSDPAGTTVSVGQTELGKTPLTIELPQEPVELVSRIGALKPVSQQISPNPDGSTVVEFKHEYGLVSVTSDRADSEVTIGGVSLGKPPIEGILPPGKHQVIVRAAGRPDQTRTADVQPGQRVVMLFTFASTSGLAVPTNPGDLLNATPAGDEASPTPRPARSPREPSKPVYRTKEEFEHARDAAYERFDNQWEARKKALEREKDYYDEQADHSEGSAKENWKRKKENAEKRLDQLDDQKDAAKKNLKRQWNDD